MFHDNLHNWAIPHKWCPLPIEEVGFSNFWSNWAMAYQAFFNKSLFHSDFQGKKIHTDTKNSDLFNKNVSSVWTKASELVPSSLFPRWNAMRFFAMGSLYDTSSLAEERFATLYRQSSNTSWILHLVRYHVVIRSRTCRHCEISKMLTLNPTLSAKNTLALASTWGMPLHAYVFSFTHNTVVFSHFRCVHPENQTKSFLILTFSWIQTNVAYTRLGSDR